MKVDFEDRKYWKPQKCNDLIKPVDLLAKSTSDVLCNFVFIFHWDDGVISMNFYPIRPVINARLNSTGWIGCKSIEIMTTKFDQAGIQYKGFRCQLISMNFYPIWPASISMNFHPIWPVIYAQSNSTGRIGCKSIEIMTTKFDQAYNVISMNFHPNQPASISMNLHPNSTGRIGCKSIEIMTTKFEQACNVISINLHPNWPASISMNLHPNLTHQVQPIWRVINARSNLTSWISPVKLGVNPLRLHCLLKAFDWHLSQWIYTQFNQSNWV